MSNISINRTGNPHSFAHKVTTKSSSDDPSSFENILNQQVGSTPAGRRTKWHINHVKEF